MIKFYGCTTDVVVLTALQCIAKTEGGKRVVAGVHWDYDCYGALLAFMLTCSC